MKVFVLFFFFHFYDGRLTAVCAYVIVNHEEENSHK